MSVNRHPGQVQVLDKYLQEDSFFTLGKNKNIKLLENHTYLSIFMKYLTVV